MHSGHTLTTLVALVLIMTGTAGHADDMFRDPTRPFSVLRSVDTPPPRFSVNAIIVSDKRRLAIVNGKRVGVGGSVDGATVISIAREKLVLDVEGRELTLTLNNGSS